MAGYGADAPDSFDLTFAECEKVGGHCWKSTGLTLMSNPPQHPEYCKHCGATRVGMSQPAYSYSEAQPRHDDASKEG